MRILVVEDEEKIRKLILMNLEMEGIECLGVGDGSEAMRLIDGQHFDVIVLDVMLPGINGFEICKSIKLSNRDTGIIIISAKNTSMDRIHGLKLGADDYLTKPFDMEELILRINNIVKARRKNDKTHSDRVMIGDWVVDFDKYVALKGGIKINLTNKESLLLKLLVQKQGEVVSRKEILRVVWGYDVYPSTRTIDNFILQFRKYFEEDPKNPKYFKSVRGVGYKYLQGG